MVTVFKVLLLVAAMRGDALTLNRRASLRRAVAATAATVLVPPPARANELYLSKQEYCEQSDRESRNGVAFGCEPFVTDERKRSRMRARAADALRDAADALDAFEPAGFGAAKANKVRAALRKPPLDGIRAQGRRLATLSAKSDAAASFDAAVLSVEALDRDARVVVERGDSPANREAAGERLRLAQRALRKLAVVGDAGDALPVAVVPPQSGGVVAICPPGEDCAPVARPSHGLLDAA